MEARLRQFGLLVAVLCATTAAYGNWVDNFDDGTFDQGWIFSDSVNAAIASPGDAAATPTPTFEARVISPGDYLAINSLTGDPRSPVMTYGFTPDVFSNVWVRGLVNVDTTTGSNCDIGLVARGDLTIGNAYVLTLDLATGAFDITKVTGLTSQVGIGHVGNLVTNPDQNTYFMEFDVRDVSPVKLIGRLYEDATMANLIAEVSALDSSSPHLAGVSGVVVAVNEQGNPPTPIGGTFDNVSSQTIPEPATLSLLALGGLAALARRRRRK